ncbi:hypothetical protein F2Q68_00015832 [Brassica cretica]|uniref:Uncharacterized protein n=1 Tax=Brassica cretica TaxID=69181 RepID=A0A8S9HN78_BRACR|nr:hypothetical protein F2Q68_00015832 [Brassica cretica]
MPRGDAKGTAVVFKPGLVDKGEAGSSCNRTQPSINRNPRTLINHHHIRPDPSFPLQLPQTKLLDVVVEGDKYREGTYVFASGDCCSHHSCSSSLILPHIAFTDIVCSFC